jgi:hypothetical protein
MRLFTALQSCDVIVVLMTEGIKMLWPRFPNVICGIEAQL